MRKTAQETESSSKQSKNRFLCLCYCFCIVLFAFVFFFFRALIKPLLVLQWRTKILETVMEKLPLILYLYTIQWRTKSLETVMEKLPLTSYTFQTFRCSIICTSLTTWTPRMALPSPPPSKQCWNEETRLGQCKVYSPAQTTTLLEEKLRQIMSIVLRVSSPIVVITMRGE